MPQLRDCVIKRGSSWSYVIRVRDPATGVSKPRWVGGFETEEDAKAARDEARVQARRGGYVNRSALTVAAYLAEWLEAHASTVKPKTLAGYRHDIEHYIVPRIGRMRLQALRPAMISKLYRDLAEHGGRDGQVLSATTISNIHRTLRKALADAVRGRPPHLPGQRRMGGVRRCGDHGVDRTDVGRQRMGAQRQPGDGPEGPAPAALECPEQVRVAGRVGGAHRPIWGDDLRLQQVRRGGARPAAPPGTNGRGAARPACWAWSDEQRIRRVRARDITVTAALHHQADTVL